MELAIVQFLVGGILAQFPGMPPGTKSFIGSLVARTPELIAAGVDVTVFITHELSRVKAMIAENRDPTQAEWHAMNSAVAAELAKP